MDENHTDFENENNRDPEYTGAVDAAAENNRAEETVMPESDVTEDPAEEKKADRVSGGRIGCLIAGIVAGFLLSLAVLMLCRGYYTITIPGIGVLSVKLPTFGIFHNADTSVDMAEFERKTEEMELYLKEFYLYGADTGEATEGAVRGFYEQLTNEDDYSAYYSKDEFAELIEDESGSFVGIGVSVIKDEATGGVLVMGVIKDGPAEEAGLKAGDIIIEADDLDLTGLELEEAVSHIKGEEGTSVTIVLLRNGEQLTYTLERRTVNNVTVYANVLEDEGSKVGYIYVSQFLGTTYQLFREAVDDLTGQGVQGFVIDMRENPGGDMNVCLSMLDYMLPDNDTTYQANVVDEKGAGNTLLLTIQGTKNIDQYFADDTHSVDLPVVMLVDANSGSAAEIFTGCMKAYGSTVTGTTTYGKGIVQTLQMLYDGAGIKYTSAEYVLPDGYHVHKVGVMPDVEVEASAELLETGANVEEPDPVLDNQLAEALRVLREKR